MRRIKAFLTALLLFLLTVGGCHLYITCHTAVDEDVFGTFASEKKGGLRSALMDYMSKEGFPVFGSSEFQHGRDTAYHPAAVFADSDFHPMLIGAGYYQSLSHAITLASIEDSMKVRRAALIVSPQWFRKNGVVDQAYASRFSETHYAGAIGNEQLSDETKQYISDRTQKLLAIDEKTQQRAQRYDEVLWKKTGGPIESVREAWWMAFLREKERFETMVFGKSREYRKSAEVTKGRSEVDEGSLEGGKAPDWDALLALAEQEGAQQNQNPFFMDDDYYKRLEPHLKVKKGMNHDADKGYQTGPEFEDLKCFLTVCQELDVEPLLVLVPVNGYYYDFTEFPKEARQKYYGKIRAIAEEYGAEVADFSDQEYTKYFFEDRVHLGKKGWVMVNESLYEFYKED